MCLKLNCMPPYFCLYCSKICLVRVAFEFALFFCCCFPFHVSANIFFKMSLLTYRDHRCRRGSTITVNAVRFSYFKCNFFSDRQIIEYHIKTKTNKTNTPIAVYGAMKLLWWALHCLNYHNQHRTWKGYFCYIIPKVCLASASSIFLQHVATE